MTTMLRRFAPVVLLALLLAGCGSPAAPATGDATAPAATAAATATAEPPASAAPTAEAPADPRAQGSADAPVTITIYSDFECPFCASFAREALPRIQQQYVSAGKVRLVFRDFPIVTSHPSAIVAAVAGRCAAAQGQFWPMHDRLFQTQGSTWGGRPDQDRQTMAQIASDLKLDSAAFVRCQGDPAVEQAVKAEADAGVDLRINGTPSFFINDRPLRGAQSFETFAQIIDEALSAPAGSRPSPAAPPPAPTASPVPTALVLPPVSQDDPRAMGSPRALVTILVYSDFECPYCSQFIRETFEQLKRAYVDTGRVRLAFRDFPLTSIHRSALVAAKASRCAAVQGQFWPMHDRLFASHDDEWGGVPKRDRKVMLEFADELKLDGAAFASCLDDPVTEQAVLQEAGSGQRLGISGTPTFFINGRPLVGAQPFEAFQQAIDQATSPRR
jgi:protein-disulfide isomerase